MQVLRKKLYGFLHTLLLGCGIFLLSSFLSPEREYQIKAVFLFNFAQFIEWPPNTFHTADAPLVIGILGQDPFGSYLDETIAGEKINGHPLVVQRYHSVDQAKNCHLLFLNISEKNKMKEALAALKGRSILTVSDVTNFIEQGGMIRFFNSNNKIQFQINPEEVKTAGLTISSKLLRLASIFVPQKNKK